MEKFSIPAAVRTVIDRLEGAGFEAYLVGGCVRDVLRGTVPHDFDVTTSALPEEMQRVFADLRTVETGLRHGTLTVLVDGEPIEVTTYRVDGDYTDSRRPDSVTFTASLTEDLARRDLTVNAMAYSPYRGFADPFLGREDLAARRLCAVGDPVTRFTEDALRILRTLRFSATLDFEIEPRTAAAVFQMAPTVRLVAAERIREEIFRLVLGKGALRVLAEYGDALSEVLPEATPTEALAALPVAVPIRLAALLYTAGAEVAETALLRLRTDRATIEKTVALCRLAAFEIPADRASLCRLLRREGEDTLRDALALRAALGKNDGVAAREVGAILAEGAPYRLSDLAVGGRDLVAIGVPPGPRLGEILEELYSEVIGERVKNVKQALLLRASEIHLGGIRL